jgi:hypothetical protein
MKFWIFFKPIFPLHQSICRFELMLTQALVRVTNELQIEFALLFCFKLNFQQINSIQI